LAKLGGNPSKFERNIGEYRRLGVAGFFEGTLRSGQSRELTHLPKSSGSPFL
jgi:hypothetical protein